MEDNPMIRVTGANGLAMSALDGMNNADTDSKTNKLTDLLTSTSGNKTNSSTSAADSKTSANYSAVKKAVSSLASTVSDLLSTSDSSLFSTAALKGDTSDIVTKVKDYVSRYNTLINALDETGTKTTTGYQSELAAITNAKADTLSAIGITQNEDGTLSVNSDTLDKASYENLLKAFSGDDSYAASVANKSVYIGASADLNATLSSVNSNNYGSNGTDYNSMVNMIGSYLDSLG